MREGVVAKGKAKTGAQSRKRRVASLRRAARLCSELAIVVEAPEVSVVPWEEVDDLVPTDLKTLVREELALLDAGGRERVLAELAEATATVAEPSLELSASLHSVREILRERLPRCAVSEERPAGLAVERILAIDERSFWVNGWTHDEDGRGELALVSPEGARVELGPRAWRHERPDVVQFYAALGDDRTTDHGFTAFFEVPAPSVLSAGWVAEMRTSDGTAVEVPCPVVTRDPAAVRGEILGELGSRGPIGGPLAERHGRKALSRLQERIVGESKLEAVDTYGEPVKKPAVSIVVPLYKRLDFLEHQLFHFSRDPELAQAELIFVLDSPEQGEELARLARELLALHRFPFRVVNLSAAGGYASANNHGIEIAKGRRLLLLNSDVIPDRPGWLGRMTGFADDVKKIGALGPKLLYEDDSLQHAGMYFHRQHGSELWENAHCFKGMHKSFGPANVGRPVPAVTGACMLVDRKLYEDIGGFPTHYVQGDFEDSELCLRLSGAGRVNWYMPAAELYHLEGQSYVPGVRRVPSEYNRWLHTALLGERIEQAMKDFDPNATVSVDGQIGGN
jgi:GT2 family glycosyltransferase